MRAEDIPHDDKVILHAIDGQPVHAQILGQQGLTVPFDDIRMILLQERVHPLHLLGGQALQDEQFVVALVEFGAAFARGVDLGGLRAGERLAVVDVVNVEAFAQILEHHRAVLFEFEVRWHVLSRKDKKWVF